MRLRLLCLIFIGYLSGFTSLNAQTGPMSEGDLRRDIAALREAVIQQTRQIDALTSEVERLGIALGQRRPVNGATPTTGAVTPAEPTVEPAKTPAVAPGMPAAATIPNTLQHTVAKGDNLTNIAKKYNTTIEAIQKLNKITDVRKLQVDQVLAIPLPPAKSPAPSSPSAPTP